MSDDVSKIKYEFLEYENSPIEISDIDSIRTQNPLFFMDEDEDFFDFGIPDSKTDNSFEFQKLNELKIEKLENTFQETNDPVPMFGSGGTSQPQLQQVPFSQQQYFSNQFVQPQGFMQPNTNYTIQQPNLQQSLNYFQDAQNQFGFINQKQGIPKEETSQVWNGFVPQFQPQIQTRSVNYIKLIEGFHQPLRGKKQPGGKDNIKHFLPKQTVQLCTDLLPKNLDPDTLSCKASVCGFDRVKRDRLILSELDQMKFTKENEYKVSFTQLLVKYSSHLNGQKLSIRFTLLDSNGKPISFIDSYEFETITKRGKEKQVEREKRKRSDDDDDIYISHVSPNIGSSMGGQLVKIYGHGFISPPLNTTLIKFGDSLVKEIHSIKRNTIVCEVPPGDVGTVPISVSFDKQNFLQSDATFQYVNPNTQEGLTFLLQSLFSNQPKNNIQKKE